MKITKSQLKQIIKEELENAMTNELFGFGKKKEKKANLDRQRRAAEELKDRFYRIQKSLDKNAVDAFMDMLFRHQDGLYNMVNSPQLGFSDEQIENKMKVVAAAISKAEAGLGR